MDRVFFEQLAMPLFDQLYNHACWLTGGDRTDAEDLVQETYAKALKGFGSFAEGTNLRAWMFRILRNIFLTSKSGLAARNTQYLEDDELRTDLAMAHDLTPELLLLRSQSEHAVFTALESLPVNYRQIILLSEVEEMSYREIAEVLDVPPGTVMSRLSRARASLRAALNANAGQEVR
ncbi:sigma-70 family RNA polymerase sigma factor [Telmatobacter sp. DSM 110680]|uniref:Sigma-70 family RNA polymerase sigma factor n=1 Tax=Telmatobacter sp. DSM 110680 TaxID=3036704 RepID=A0AAU7DKS8_9BACT